MADEFERILSARYVPEMRSNLAERIISASLQEPIRKTGLFMQWLADFWDGFALPKPAYAMAVALFIGVFVGFSPDSLISTGLLDSTDIASYFQADDSIATFGEWS